MAIKNLPLSGISVVEFTHMVMGPSAGLILADLGAEVTKVEPLKGDNTRRLDGSGSGYFLMYNRNKRSLCVDLKSAQGKELALRLAGQADVLIENFRPSAMDKLGFGYEDLRKINPGLIYCSLKGFLSGPYGHRTALDEVAQMMGGLAYMTGQPDKPMRAGSSVIDITGGMFGVIGILAALERRHRTGEGEKVTSSLFETTAFLVGQHMAQQAVSGKPVPPMSVRQSAWSVYDIFYSEEGERVFVGVVSDTLWRKFCEEFQLDEYIEDKKLATNSERVKARVQIIPRISRLFSQMSKQEMMDRLDRAGIPFAPINTPEDLFEDPHLMQGQGLLPVTIPRGPHAGEKANLPAVPIEMGQEKLPIRADLPAEGEHSIEVMRNIGYSENAINQMIDDGIVKVCLSDNT